jgi:CBS domain-containing protein
MSHLVLTIGPAHTLRQAVRMMSARRIGAAVVIDPEHADIVRCWTPAESPGGTTPQPVTTSA